MKTNEMNPLDYHSKLVLNRADVFAEDSYLSKSTIWGLYQSSLYKWRYYPGKFEPGPAMTWGSLVDCLVTAPEEYEDKFCISEFDSFRTKAAREWKEEMADAGKTVITEKLLEDAQLAVDMLTKKHKYAASLIEKSKAQVVLIDRVQHPSASKPVNVKGLVDLAPEGKPFLIDLKTTSDFTPSGFERSIAKYGYHVQAAHYLGMWNSLYPNDQRHRFQIIWQSSTRPYEVAVTELPETDLADGADMFNHLLGRIVRAAERNYWPMKFPEPVLLSRASFGAFADGLEIDGFTASPK